MLIGVRPKMVVNRLRDFLLSRLGGDTVHYVQVGANDGFLDDPVYKIARARNWSALLIEPNPRYFAALSKNYEGRDRFRLLNCGVSETPGKMDLHFLAPEAEGKYPPWAKGCASLDRDRLIEVLTRVTPPAPEDIASTTITLRRLDDILTAENITRTDLLVIDVEGHEVSVLKSLDLTQIRPKAILLESNGGDAVQDGAIRAHLTAAGYTLHRLGDDIFAYNDMFPKIETADMIKLIGLDRIDLETPINA
jgi:FkbM family methyltransferase